MEVWHNMTQIKLRRDTSANFTSKNPVLGLGEPAYEIDTKKLKIGDGTTAYTQLEYFSAGGGGSADIGAALPLKIVNGVISIEVDGQTIQVVDGKLAASANMVTTNTTQNISGQKEFDKTILFLGNNDLLRAQQSTSYRNGAGLSMGANSTSTDGGVFAPQWKIYNTTGDVDRTETIVTTYNQSKLNSSNFNTANKLVRLDLDGKLPAVDGSNLTNLPGGLEVCDIGMALYVDETKGLRRYLNGQIVDINTNTQAFSTRLQEITTLHPSLLCTEEEWQTAKTNSAFGQVGKFVFNYSGEEIVSVRIPRVVNVQGLFDLQNLGMTVSSGLPNIKGSITGDRLFGQYASSMSSAGALKLSTTSSSSSYTPTSSGDFNNGFSFDASYSNPIYGNSDTVQPEAVQYPYFIQVATGSETENNIINEIELNNPYSLFDSKYSDHELNNLSWLKSEGQWNAKAVYPTAYDKLLKVYNGTENVEGLSVKLSIETYTDYDFVLNTADETFRLPLKTKLASGKAVVGNGMTLGLSNGTTNFGLGNFNNNNANTPLSLYANTYGQNVGSTNGTQYKLIASSIGVTTDPTKSGIELSDSGLYLYYYVGETVQNANLIDAGRIGEVLATKTDMLQASGAGMPSNRYINLTLGASGSTYTAPANGYFAFGKRASAVGQFFNVTYISPAYIPSWSDVSSGATSNILGHLVPVQKNQIIRIYYNAGGDVTVCRFIYAEGSK